MPEKVTPLRRRIAPSVPLTIHGEQFVLCLDGDALCALEEKVPSLNTLNLGGLEIFSPKNNATVIRAALWAAVLRHHPEYDTKDKTGQQTSDGLNAIGSFIDSSNMGDVVTALEQAYLATLPDERRDEILRLAEKGKEMRQAEEDLPAAAEAPNPPAAGAIASDGSNIGASADMTSDLAIAKPAASA